MECKIFLYIAFSILLLFEFIYFKECYKLNKLIKKIKKEMERRGIDINGKSVHSTTQKDDEKPKV